MTETSGSQAISTKLQRIAKLAKEIRDATLKTLAHHIDVDWLREAYRSARKDGAPGVDGVSAKQYAEHLEDNLRSLLERAKSGRYWAPPVRRVHIPKGDGTATRPIGIPTFLGIREVKSLEDPGIQPLPRARGAPRVAKRGARARNGETSQIGAR